MSRGWMCRGPLESVVQDGVWLWILTTGPLAAASGQDRAAGPRWSGRSPHGGAILERPEGDGAVVADGAPRVPLGRAAAGEAKA